LTAAQHDLTIRPITGPGELDLFCELPYVLNEELAGDLESGRRRPGWMWVALDGGHLVARAAWWARHAGAGPDVLDIFDIVEHPRGVGIGARLLQTAMATAVPAGRCAPEYSRFVPPDWRAHIASRRVVREPMAAIEQTGGRFFVERLRFEWHPGTPIPEPSGRLAFRPVEERTQLVTLMTAVLEGTLDAHGRADLVTMSPEEAAIRQYQGELMSYESPRDWWLIAELPGGVPVGFVIPAHNGYHPIIAYIGVVPAHRGNGYVHEILAEGTRILAGQDVPRIRASTDLGNTPMAEAFRRAGWVNFGRTINMTWS
jgi:RimJ/RimL family protein N-acetyltransferase/GNAT superfamily N-acetyltransferase